MYSICIDLLGEIHCGQGAVFYTKGSGSWTTVNHCYPKHCFTNESPAFKDVFIDIFKDLLAFSFTDGLFYRSTYAHSHSGAAGINISTVREGQCSSHYWILKIDYWWAVGILHVPAGNIGAYFVLFCFAPTCIFLLSQHSQHIQEAFKRAVEMPGFILDSWLISKLYICNT